MRKLALESRWAALGAKFGELGGAQCVESPGDADAEVAAIRNTAALCDFSFAKKYSYDESEGLDALDAVLAANILKLRCHTRSPIVTGLDTTMFFARSSGSNAWLVV